MRRKKKFKGELYGFSCNLFTSPSLLWPDDLWQNPRMIEFDPTDGQPHSQTYGQALIVWSADPRTPFPHLPWPL